MSAYQLVTAHYGHDTKGFDVRLLGIERRVCAIVSENYVGMYVGVQVRDSNIVADDGVFEARLGLGIAAVAASPVIGRATLLAIAIDVHVDKLLPVAVQVDDSGCCVFTVSEC